MTLFFTFIEFRMLSRNLNNLALYAIVKNDKTIYINFLYWIEYFNKAT